MNIGLQCAGLMLAGLFFSSQATAAVVDIYDDSIQSGQTKTWDASNSYVLHGKVCIEDGARLNIAAGTVVRGDAGEGIDASMLVVCRGGRLYAEGTADAPIIFTSILDSLDDATDFPIASTSRGLWGGIVMCGRAPNNIPGGEGNGSEDITVDDIEKVTFGDSTNPDADDTSGVLRYVSIRYAGMTDLSEARSLSLWSVGRGTVIDYVEAVCGQEDGIDIAGGTVDMKHIVSFSHAGDCFYYDRGYTGRAQFLYAQQTVVSGGSKNGICLKVESDDEGFAPVAAPTWHNCTFVGTGVENADTWKYKYAMIYKANGAGVFANSIVTQTYNYGIWVEDVLDTLDATDSLLSSRQRLNDGDLRIVNNIFYGFGKGNTVDSIAKGAPFLFDYLSDSGNVFVDPELGGFTWTPTATLDLSPAADGPAYENLAETPSDDFFSTVDYRGAFGVDNWADGWTFISEAGYFSPTFENAIVEAPRALQRAAGIRANGSNVGISLVKSAADVRIDVLSLAGRKIASVNAGSCSAGYRTVSLPAQLSAAGSYVLVLHADGERLAVARYVTAGH